MYIREVRQCGKNRVADIRHFFNPPKYPPFSEKTAKKPPTQVGGCSEAKNLSLRAGPQTGVAIRF